MVFSTAPRRGLLARSGWEQEEARTVLRDLGWEWEEELHALVPPDDVPDIDAGIQAVAELHLHGHRTGYAIGPYGTMRLSLARAEQVFTKLTAQQPAQVQAEENPENESQAPSRRKSALGGSAASLDTIPVREPDSPAI
ncbi:hypothetical protein [Streptomyces guryensis]|uniref:Uncharacterized protein n=1 Tax=Streptomyces guryensis TaxID=2886947 RepID=A0A9Q3VZC9_9ACTN|nr:hypothetical protein [Streptomyces guryensis]MCD9880403.1 hypothetical protein [Streptomyces guryensis]